MAKHEVSLLIGGASIPAANGATYETVSPATGEVAGRVADAQPADLDRAIGAAQSAFGAWSSRTAYERESIIRKASAHARSQAEEMGRLMALEQGKPLKQSIGEASSSCGMLDYYAAEAVRIEGYTNPTEKPSLRSWVTYQPVGVCAVITPWNYPVALLSWKLGPALAAGCTVVVKPTPITPACAVAFCRALQEGGLPPGVINVVTGSGPELGERLVKDDRVAKVAMTGSTRIGKKILESCAPSLKRVSLELGGHCPAVVCADADVELAAQVVAYKGFRNGGQSCSTVNRAFVHSSLFEDFVELLIANGEKMTIGDGLSDGSVDLGPLCTREVLAQVESHVADAVEGGATVLSGGSRLKEGPLAAGNYFPPTVLTGVGPDRLMMREETFGPVVPVLPFDDLDDAIERANDTNWGLAAYLFTRDLATAHRASEQLEAGTVCVNNVAVNTPYGPYEGWGDSGYGVELSRRAIFEYLKTKHIKISI